MNGWKHKRQKIYKRKAPNMETTTTRQIKKKNPKHHLSMDGWMDEGIKIKQQQNTKTKRKPTQLRQEEAKNHRRQKKKQATHNR